MGPMSAPRRRAALLLCTMQRKKAIRKWRSCYSQAKPTPMPWTIGNTPLHCAAAFDLHKDVAELLLAHKAEINAKNKEGETSLHLAALAGRKDVSQLLLESGADVNAKSKDDLTPLHLAATKGQTEVIMLLLAKQADINAKDKLG